MELDVYFDVICPWCYLGHRRLEAAIARLGSVSEEISLNWRSFQLDPSATAEPGDLRVAIEAKYGPGTFDAMSSRLTELGTEVDIGFRFDRAMRVGTRDAHRLVQWTQATHPDAVTPLVDRLFRAYFTDGANVADHATLTALATAIPTHTDIEVDEITELLSSDAWSGEVRADQSAASELGVTGVPAVVFNGATIIPGAQDTDTTETILRRLHAKVG